MRQLEASVASSTGGFRTYSGIANETIGYAPETKRWFKRTWDERDPIGACGALVVEALLESDARK